jgi:hypothetical protein
VGGWALTVVRPEDGRGLYGVVAGVLEDGWAARGAVSPDMSDAYDCIARLRVPIQSGSTNSAECELG